MEELIKRLERVIQTGAPDKDGQHPISAETVLEVVKGLSEHGTDCISRQQAIDAVRATLLAWSYMPEWRDNKIIEAVRRLPSAQPEIIRCRDCKLRDTEYCNMAHGFMGMKDDDYCSYAERRWRRTND